MKSGLNIACLALIAVTGCLSLAPDASAGGGVRGRAVRPPVPTAPQTEAQRRAELLGVLKTLRDTQAEVVRDAEERFEQRLGSLRIQIADIIARVNRNGNGSSEISQILSAIAIADYHCDFIRSQGMHGVSSAVPVAAAALIRLDAPDRLFVEVIEIGEAGQASMVAAFGAYRAQVADLRQDAIDLVKELTN